MWDYLEPVAKMLEPWTLVHRFDQRGCGGSDPSRQHTVARYVADIEALRQHWRHETWIVLGHSFGATLAFAYAAAHPDRSTAMCYLSGVGVGDWHSLYRAERERRMTRDQRRRMVDLKAKAARSDFEEREFRALSWFTDYADPAHAWDLALANVDLDRVLNVEANSLLNAETTWSTTKVLEQARKLTMPCWFIHGVGDPRPSSTVADLAAAIPGAKLHLIEGAGHDPWRERPDALRELLAELVSIGG